MSIFRIFMLSNDVTANWRLLLFSFIIGPLLQIGFVFYLVSSSSIDMYARLPFICASTVYGFSIFLATSSMTADRIAGIYSQFLIGRPLSLFILLRFCFTALCALILSVIELLLLSIFSFIYPIELFILVEVQHILILVFCATFGGTVMGLALSFASITFADPFKLTNILLPLLPVFLPVIVPMRQLPLLLRLFSYLIPGSWTMDSLQTGSPIYMAVFIDILLGCGWLTAAILKFSRNLKHISLTGKSENPY